MDIVHRRDFERRNLYSDPDQSLNLGVNSNCRKYVVSSWKSKHNSGGSDKRKVVSIQMQDIIFNDQICSLLYMHDISKIDKKESFERQQ